MIKSCSILTVSSIYLPEYLIIMVHDIFLPSVYKGLSTYDYIVAEREKAEAAARDQDLETNQYSASTSRCKPNKVRPGE